MDSVGDNARLAEAETIKNMIKFLKQNPDKMLEVFNRIKNLCGINGTIKEKNGRIYLEKFK